MRSNFREVRYRYLLDTNILSDLVKHPMGMVFDKIQSVGEEKICTSIIVACELRFGAEKSGSSEYRIWASRTGNQKLQTTVPGGPWSDIYRSDAPGWRSLLSRQQRSQKR